MRRADRIPAISPAPAPSPSHDENLSVGSAADGVAPAGGRPAERAIRRPSSSAAPPRRIRRDTRKPARLGGEAVADSSLVHNQRRALRIGLDLAAQGMDECVQGLAIASGIGSPEPGEDVAEGRNPACLARNSGENAQLRA